MANQVSRTYPLYQTTFTTLRLSPLYHGPDVELDNSALAIFASRLRDVLVGNVLRGVTVGLTQSDDSLGRVGSLRSCRWLVFKDEEDWLAQDADITVNEGNTTLSASTSPGIHIEIAYERATYTALLLRQGNEALSPGFTYFPLLLARMPTSLRETLTTFLASTFDTLAQPLRLPPSFLTSSLETYMMDLTQGLDSNNAERMLSTSLRDVLVTLSFDLPSQRSTLKTIDMQLARNDLHRFWSLGQKLSTEKDGLPFTKSLEHYVDGHLGMDLRDERVKIAKVACGAFVMGMEGKIKLFPPVDSGDGGEGMERAGRALVQRLIEVAAGFQS